MKYQIIALSIVSMLVSCADETGFQGSASKQKNMDNENPRPGLGNESDANANNDWESTIDETSGKQKLMLKLPPSSLPPADYLFVVDNSSSMSSLVGSVQTGFVNIAENGEFPENAKIGVISTAVDGINDSNVGAREGFKALVDQNSIASSKRDNKSSHPGCKSGWFSPKEMDANNEYCLVSATKFQLVGTGYEAGISSYDNFLDAQINAQPFRKGALLNVIFISDTHDIGKHSDGDVGRKLVQRRDAYTYEGLAAKTRSVANVQSVKFHAVAPLKGQGDCSNEKDHGTYAYSKLVEASKGKEAHCEKVDYADFISDMVTNSKKSNKILSIPETLTKAQIDRVLVEGKEVEFAVNESKSLIMLKNVDVSGNKELNVEIVQK
jgi:hypothetical protein